MRSIRSLSVLLFGLYIGSTTTMCMGADKVDLGKIPEKVSAAIKARFPSAEIIAVEKETENGGVVFDVTLKEKGRKYEMDIKEDGTVTEVENEVEPKDFPATGARAIEAKYPKSTIKEIMEVNLVKDKVEKPDHYEVTLTLADGNSKEVSVSLDGKNVTEEADSVPAPQK